jgi:O-antigen ligase
LPLIAKNPLGYGAGQSGDVLGFKTGSFQTIDNYYLSIALEYGVVGFVLYYGLLLMMMYLSARAVMYTPRNADPEQDFIVPIAISLAVFFVIKLVFSQQDNHPLIYMMMGMLMALFFRTRRAVGVQPPVAAS